MANFKSNMNKITVSGELAKAVLEIFDPVCNAVNETYNEIVTINGAGPEDSHGKHPSENDLTIRITLGQMMNNLYRSNYVGYTTKDGRVGESNYKRFTDSEDKLNSLTDDQIETAQGATAFKWYNVNKAKFEAIDSLLEELKLAYGALTKEKWEPMNIAPPVAAVPKLSEEKRAAIQAARDAIKQSHTPEPRRNIAVGSN